MIIGADVGGTFTDIVLVDDGVITTTKVPTSAIQSAAVAQGARSITPPGRGVSALIHGTTVATNALLEQKGARTVLVTDAGFEDVIEIARQDRPSLYDPFHDRPEPLVARSDRIGVDPQAEAVDVGEAESIAIACIDGHRAPERERGIAEMVRARGSTVPISLSSEVAPEFREYERISTTVLNAYLAPVTSRYLEALHDEIVGAGLAGSVSVMRSSGGLMSLHDAANLPAAVLLSGPAGGVVAARAVADSLGYHAVVSFDMGGTSTDVCLIEDGVIDISYERSVAGYTCRLPSAGIHTVGAGGGSVAWIDPGGALRVGPRSAGAMPGPACYGRGGSEPTVTDANVVLGRIDPGGSFGGSIAVDEALARRAIRPIASSLSLSIEDASLGIVAIAEEVMAGAVRSVSVDQGADPTHATLIAYGGAGGLHASAVARSLGMAGVAVPVHAGVLSAIGLLLAPPRADGARSVHIDDGDLMAAAAAASDLADDTARQILGAGHSLASTSHSLDVRYIGQAHEITVGWDVDETIEVVTERFQGTHDRRYGFSRPGDPIEIVAVRATSFGPAPLTHRPTLDPGSDARPPGERPVVCSDGVLRRAAVLHRVSLAQGDIVDGPAIIEESGATTFIDIDERATLEGDRSLVITW
ncbi:MAG TPA: hydantoinase/oxoprolinase family protein [Acidimicrobiia bacterium]|nr:hydantoinase/oxoprolinase family protein [Acidimicrobiia bacterium]